MHNNLSDGDVIFCSKTPLSSRRYICELTVPGFDRPIQLLRSELDRFQGLAVCVRNGFSEYRQRSYECRYYEVIVVRICSSSHNFLCVPRVAESDNIFVCLLTAMAKVQSMDSKASFLFVSGVNAHHEEWRGSSTMNFHGTVARDLASSSGCEQMVTAPTHIYGRVLSLMLTDVPDVVGVRVGSPVGTSDHSGVFIDVMLELPIPHLVCRQEIFLKNSVHWELVIGNVKSLNWNRIIMSLARHRR